MSSIEVLHFSKHSVSLKKKVSYQKEKGKIYLNISSFFPCVYFPTVLLLLSCKVPPHLKFPVLPSPWSDPLAVWLHCEWCVYGEGFGPKHYRTQILIPLTALSALGLHMCAHVWVSHVSRSVSVRACVQALYRGPCCHLSFTVQPTIHTTCLHQISISSRLSTCAALI